MSDQQRNPPNDGMPSAKHINHTNVTDESKIRIDVISIRGGGGEKRKLENVADGLLSRAQEKDFSSNRESFEREQQTSSNNNITNSLRNRNNSMLSSPQKPLPSSSNTTAPARTPQRSDIKLSSVASPGRQQPQDRETGSKDQKGSQLAANQQPDAHNNSLQKEDAPRHILKHLETLCDHYSRDIHFTFLPSPTTTNTKSRIDLSGSFLRSEDESLDFFDLNDKGEITLQPRPPIFPEELSSSGMKEHSLRWWGVEDPAVGDGRFKAVPAQTVPQHAAPVMGGDNRSRQMMNDNNYRRGEEYSNGHDRSYNSRDFHNGPPGGPPHLDRSRGPDRRRDRR